MANTCNKVIPQHLPTFDKAQRSHDVQQAPQLPSPSTSEESAGKKAGLETAIHFFGVFTKRGYGSVKVTGEFASPQLVATGSFRTP